MSLLPHALKRQSHLLTTRSSFSSMSSQRILVPAATIVKEESYRIVGGLNVIDRWFSVPLDYKKPDAKKIRVFARNAVQNKNNDDGVVGGKLPYMVYLQGGPGYECGPPKSHPLTQYFFGKDYQVLYVDQRGTGLSTPVSANTLAQQGDEMEQYEYLKLMRADNIVRDCEAIRKALLESKEPDQRKWSLIGQSFGGFCAVTYLSFYPENLKEVFTTGGMPPLVNQPDVVYERLYKKVTKRNLDYYAKYPQDVKAVKEILKHLNCNEVKLPSGGILTDPRFRSLGLGFGGHGGIDGIHQLVQRAQNELELFGEFTHKLLQSIESHQNFDGNPLYAVIHEAVYCQGEHNKSEWSAAKILNHQTVDPRFQKSSEEPAFFTGEMIYPNFFDSFSALKPLKKLAERIAATEDWPALYDVEQLKNNTVPVYAANYIEDMYVDFGFASETARTIKGAKTFETNILFHNAVRTRSEAVMSELWKLKIGEMD